MARRSATHVAHNTRSTLLMLRVALLLVSLACVAAAILGRDPASPFYGYAWPLLPAALLVALPAQLGVTLPGTALTTSAGPSSRSRRIAGAIIALAGAALFAWATWGLTSNWPIYFDRGWLAWLTGTCLLSIGLDLLWARWERPPRP